MCFLFPESQPISCSAWSLQQASDLMKRDTRLVVTHDLDEPLLGAPVGPALTEVPQPQLQPHAALPDLGWAQSARVESTSAPPVSHSSTRRGMERQRTHKITGTGLAAGPRQPGGSVALKQRGLVRACDS